VWALLAAGSTLWAALSLAVALAPAGSPGRSAAVIAASWTAQFLGGAALLVAASRRRRGAGWLPWTLFCAGVAARLGADVVWVGTRVLGVGPVNVFQVAAHAVSYALLFAVLLWLMSTLRREMVSVAALDTASVMLTTALLVWYFALGSDAWLGGGEAIEVLARLARPVCDLGLLFLGLAAVLSVRRPPFVVVMTGGLFALLAADAVYLGARGDYDLGMAEALWSGGVMLLAFAALAWGGTRVSSAEHVGPFGVVLFWFGPLSPLLQYGFLLLWGTLRGPLPPYVMAGGAVLAVVLALRMYEITRALRRQARRETALARQAEGGRILRELHDTVKQGVHGTSLMIEAAALAEKNGDDAAVRDLLAKALETSRETGHELSKPLDELRLLSGHAGDPQAFFGDRLKQFGERFGMETRQSLRAPLSDLSPEELSVAHRVFAEAAWNAAKHSGARNLLLETCREKDGFVLRLRDDGRGFDPGAGTNGYGMRSMRSRAEEVGARLGVSSVPGEGTTVELRLRR
jgi:signal transduction histidine kinase